MVKRLWKLLMVMLGVLLLSSCYIMSTRPTGTISLRFGESGGRSISPTASVRVYLYTYSSASSYSLFTFPNGSKFAEYSYGSGTRTLTGIPIGLWQVLVSVGNSGPSGYFQTTSYGASSVINVLPGTDTGASIETVASPIAYSPDLAGIGLNDVFAMQGNGYVYASSNSMLFEGAIEIDATVTPSIAAIPSTMSEVASASQIAANSLQIQSINGGYYYYTTTPATGLFVNTNKGIVPYDMTNGFDVGFSQYHVDSSGKRYTVLQSAAVEEIFVTGANAIALVFGRAQGLGGVYLTPNNTVPTTSTGAAPWIDVGLPGSTESHTVYDVAVNGDQTDTPILYFATAGGAFRSDLPMIQPRSTASQDLSKYANYFSAPDGSTIHRLAVLNGTLFIATDTGVYYGAVQETDLAQPPVSSWSRVSGISNDAILQIAPRAYYDAQQIPHYVLALHSVSNLYLFDSANSRLTTYPFYAGLPGELRSIAWFGSLLLVAGSEGLAALQVAPIEAFSGY